ncbi:MAG TPA: YdbH domain-containing protein, partial [Blastocatellia bacterium]
MRKRLLIGALTAAGLAAVFVVSLFVYVRSGRLDRFVQKEVIQALADVGIKAEVGRAHLELRPYKVKLEDIRLYTERGARPFGTIDSIEASFAITDYFKQDVVIRQVNVTGPQLVVDIDENGRSELQSLHAPPKSNESHGGAVTFASARFDLTGGRVQYDDRSRSISADVPDISATYLPVDPNTATDAFDGSIEAGFNGGRGKFQGHAVNDISSSVRAKINGDEADLSELSVKSSLGQASLNGRMPSLQSLKYDLKFKAGFSIQKIADLIDSRAGVAGTAGLEGAATGTGADYHLVASVSSGSVAADGIRINGLRFSTNAQGDLQAYKATAEIQSSGAESATAGVGRTSMALTVSGSGTRPNVAGSFAMASIQGGRVSVTDLKGRLEANRERLALSDVSASVLGGSVTGSASVALSGGESKADLAFKSVDLGQAVELAPAQQQVKIAGSTDGTADVAFPGLDYRAASGRLDLTFEATVARPESDGGTAATGQVNVALTPGGLSIEKALVHSADSDLTATGTIDRDGNASLTASFDSKDMAEVQHAIDALELIPEDVSDKYHIELAGPGVFSGQIQGTLSAPSLTGHVSLADIKSQEDSIASLQGDIQFSRDKLSISNGMLVRPDGTRAEFSMNAPLDGGDDISARASLTNFDMHALAKIASPGLEDYVTTGTISGSVDVSGLPGPRTIKGTANVSISNAEFNLPNLSEGKDDETKMSVPQFVGEVGFENSVLTVRDLQARIGDSQFDGHFSFNLDTYSYVANVEGKNIDLGRVAGAFTDSAPVAGTADLSIKGQGDWDDWSTITLQAVIQGHGVSYAGRDFGDAKLTATTEAGILKLDTSGTLLGTPRAIEATVDLRDKKNYPIAASVDFTDTDLGPYLGLISP